MITDFFKVPVSNGHYPESQAMRDYVGSDWFTPCQNFRSLAHP